MHWRPNPLRKFAPSTIEPPPRSARICISRGSLVLGAPTIHDYLGFVFFHEHEILTVARPEGGGAGEGRANEAARAGPPWGHSATFRTKVGAVGTGATFLKDKLQHTHRFQFAGGVWVKPRLRNRFYGERERVATHLRRGPFPEERVVCHRSGLGQHGQEHCKHCPHELLSGVAFFRLIRCCAEAFSLYECCENPLLVSNEGLSAGFDRVACVRPVRADFRCTQRVFASPLSSPRDSGPGRGRAWDVADLAG